MGKDVSKKKTHSATKKSKKLKEVEKPSKKVKDVVAKVLMLS